MIERRQVIAGGAAAALMAATPALALDGQDALGHVHKTVDEVVAVMTAGLDETAAADGLLRVMRERAALRQIARFAAGRSWREMDAAQQARFTDAFSGFVARSYARQFAGFELTRDEVLNTILIRRAVDAGRKGILVETEIRPPNTAPVAMNFLVSDRTGRLAIADMVVEGVSLAVTQREIVGAMLDARGGDIDALIRSLEDG